MKQHILKSGFLFSDLLAGGKVNWHLRNMRELYSSSAKMSEFRAAKLKEILEYACRSTAHYASFAGANRLQDFPVLSQATLRYSLEDFTTGDKKVLENSVQASTSGSYGMPMVFSFDRDKYARRRAEVIHFNSLAGFELGMRYARIHTSLKAIQSTSSAMARRQNLFDIYLSGTADNHLGAACERLSEGKMDVLLGWPSLLSGLVAFADKRNVKVPKLRTIVSYGEVLTDEDRELIGKAFGCPVFDRYACTELGVIAHDFPGGPRLGINEASYVVELLEPERDLPAKPGTRGRVVITDLYSKAIPLIRYDTGDTALVAEAGLRPHISRIEGRYNETIFDTKGNPMLSLQLYSALDWSQKKLMRQFQIAQTAETSYELVVIPKSRLDACALVSGMKAVLGEDAEVAVRLVDKIDPLPSGKRPVIVNRVQQANSASRDPS